MAKKVAEKVAKKAVRKAPAKRAKQTAAPLVAVQGEKKMAKVIAKLSGGAPKEIEAATLGELKQKMEAGNYQATINGDTENDNERKLVDYDVVTLTAQVKGA